MKRSRFSRKAAVHSLHVPLIAGILSLVCANVAHAAKEAGEPPTNDTLFFSTSDGKSALATRTFQTTGDTISVWVNSCSVANVTFNEVKRQSTLVQDLTKIEKQAEGTKAACGMKAYSYVLKYRRSTLTLTALKSDGSQIGTLVVATGPPEHLFISLDLPVTKLSTLKYNSTSNTLLPTSSNPQLYWSLNYQLGDVVDTSKLSPIDRLNLEFMFQASSKPLDSFGVAIGYVLPAFSELNLSSLSIFGGYFWTKQDSLVGSVVQTNSVYGHAWRFGISYNLDDALKWVKF